MRELKYFSRHPHLLILREMLEYDGEEAVCSGCGEPMMSGLCYSCASCKFFLHIKCANLPQKIRHPLHREHPLLLLPEPPTYYERGCICHICKETCKDFVYHCSLCGFDLDIKCASPPCLSEAGSQAHQLRCLIPSIALKSGSSFTCNACGTDGDDSPLLCTMCLLMFHDNCISLPQTIDLFMHNHSRIVHTYFIGQCGPVKQYCGICREEVKAGFGGYCCLHCEFAVHVSCGLKFRDEEGENLGTVINEQIMESAFDTIREIELGSEIVIVEIKHFSHQHNLILMDEIKRDLKCDGCMLPIFSSYYGCAECGFFLDKSCIQLPRRKQILDQRPITLLSKACTSDGVFFCPICTEYRHGFGCKNNRSEDVIDVQCFRLMDNWMMIEHESHEHPLFAAEGIVEYPCNACGVLTVSELKCPLCGFMLHVRCANMPCRVWHKYDDHPLSLTYVDPNTYQFYCLICEKERDPKLWFYRCEVCDFDAHVECVLGKHPYIKFGGTYTYDFHSHPLTLVENIEGDHACYSCGESCNDFVLVCTDSDCIFIAHKRCFLSDPDS